jgi:hypothetical protein
MSEGISLVYAGAGVPVAAAGSCNLPIIRQFFSFESRIFALNRRFIPHFGIMFGAHSAWKAQR